MKVLCINKDSRYLTTWKWYDVKGEDKIFYLLIDDLGNEWRYPKSFFKTQAEVRDEKLRELGI